MNRPASPTDGPASGPAATTVLHVAGLCRSFHLGTHTVAALRGVDLSLAEGEMLALTGPSGSGKSTLLNLAGLIDRPDAGQIWLGGRPVGQLDDTAATLLRRDALGFIFQGFNLVPVMTVADNVDYPLFLAGVPAPERAQRVARALAAVGLSGHAGHRPDALSGGQRQRVAIARALVKRPRLVIADEPTASLDSHTAEQVLDLLREGCKQQGAAVLVATHDPRVTRRCDRVLVMDDGRLVANTTANTTADALPAAAVRLLADTESLP